LQVEIITNVGWDEVLEVRARVFLMKEDVEKKKKSSSGGGNAGGDKESKGAGGGGRRQTGVQGLSVGGARFGSHDEVDGEEEEESKREADREELEAGISRPCRVCVCAFDDCVRARMHIHMQ
jgi:hypothetical protein